MKRNLFASLLAAVCSFSAIPMSASAANLSGESEAALSISNAKSGDQFAAYKVVDIEYVSESNTLSYTWNSDFAAYFSANGAWDDALTNSTTIGNDDKVLTVEEFSGLNGNQLQLVLANLANYASGKTVVGSGTAGDDGKASFGNQHMGGYFIVPTSTTEVYAPIFTKIEPTINSGDYALEASEHNVETKHNSVSVEKTVRNVTQDAANSNNTIAFQDSVDATVNDELEYQIIAAVPKYDDSALYKSFEISDVLPSGLTYVENSVTVQAVEATSDVEVNPGTNYTLTIGDNADTSDRTECFTVSVNKEQYNTAISDSNTWYNMSQIKITFRAKLNSDAVIAAVDDAGMKKANTNTAFFSFADYPYINSDSYTVVTDTANVLTYGLQVYKYATAENKTDKVSLKGAEFSLYTDADCKNQLGGASLTTDDKGLASFNGLAPGTYYLKETKAPTGYNLLEGAIPVKIITTGDAGGDAYLVATADNSNTKAKNGYATISVENHAGFTLPFTGGAGAILFCVLGILFMLAAVALITVFFVTVLKKKTNTNK